MIGTAASAKPVDSLALTITDKGRPVRTVWF